MAGLWNDRLVLLNKTSIPYRQLTIPCCTDCNGGPLSELESEVRNAFIKGVDSVKRLPDFRLFQWCSKIHYGLLFKEYQLRHDRSTSSDETIVPRQFLESLDTFHLFMRSIRTPFTFADCTPFSVFVARTRQFGRKELDFDYMDSVFLGDTYAPCFAIRINDVGLICVFQDDGQQKYRFQDEFDQFNDYPLHPVQFIEFTCKSFYKHSLLNYVPRYLIIEAENDEGEVHVQAWSPFPEMTWKKWDNEAFAKLFHSFLLQRSEHGITDFKMIYPDSGEVGTWLRTDDDRPMRIGPDGGLDETD